MSKEENRYEILKSAYEFLNQQMSLFERTVELQLAEYRLLKEIGRYVSASKVQLTRYQEGTYILVNEWKKDKEYQAGIMEQEQIFINDPGWTAIFKQKKSVYIKDVEHMQEDLKNSYKELKKESINSIFVLPVLDDNQLIGIVTICNPDDKKIAGIEEIHEILGNWLGYRLIKNDNRIEKILSGLGGDYTAAYMINLDTDYFEVIINQKTNHSAKQKKDLTFEEYVRKYADKYVLEEYREAMKRELNWRNFKTQFKTKKEFYFTFETPPNDIGQSCFQAHAVREYGDDGNYAVVGFRCVDELIKKERAYQRELDQAYQIMKKQLDIITSAIPGGIKISDDDAKYSFKYVSKQYAAMLGYTVEEFMEASGGTIVGIAHPDDLESGIAEALRQYETADNYAITYRMKCKDGSWKYIEDHGHKVINSEGKVEHWNLILDKNELVQKTIELESERKASAAKTAFLSRMSHDIRTPLNGIIGMLDINEKHPNDRKLIMENRKKARVAANHLLSLINDILELNRLGDDNVVLCEEVFNIEKLIQETRTIIWMKAQEDGITMVLEGDYENLKEPYVMGSPLHIQQIFINIITNAIKYNKPGGSVYCHLKEVLCDENHVTYQVVSRDTGIGMRPEFLKTIFQPFTQETQDARSVYQGTGLGMSIVKNLVDRMGGTIEIESEPGVGTVVSVSLTFKIAKKPNQLQEAKVETKDLDLTGVHVLLAEDNELNREIARFILQDEKMIVTETENGEQAVKQFCEASEGTFDVILMDVMMPVMDGLEATRKIRQLQRTDASSIPIFAMTANAFAEDRKLAKEAGMNEHLSKPLDAKLLVEKIWEYCRK